MRNGDRIFWSELLISSDTNVYMPNQSRRLIQSGQAGSIILQSTEYTAEIQQRKLNQHTTRGCSDQTVLF